MIFPVTSRTHSNDHTMINHTTNKVPKIIETLEKQHFEMWNEYNQEHHLDNSILQNEFVTTKIQAFESNRKFDNVFSVNP